jgi:hypothetical protein
LASSYGGEPVLDELGELVEAEFDDDAIIPVLHRYA